MCYPILIAIGEIASSINKAIITPTMNPCIKWINSPHLTYPGFVETVGGVHSPMQPGYSVVWQRRNGTWERLGVS